MHDFWIWERDGMKMVLKMVALNLPPTLKEKGGGYIKFEALEKNGGKKWMRAETLSFQYCVFMRCVVPPIFEIQKAFINKNYYSFRLVGEVDL